jgi:outer membrane lipoprotein LolB
VIRPAVLLSALFIAGCATVPVPTSVPDPEGAWRHRAGQLAALDRWTLTGRLAVRSDSQGGNATLRWMREGDRHRIDLTGPLGRGHVRVVQDGDGAELRDDAGVVQRAASAEELLWRATGYRLPLAGLPYWALGVSRPGEEGSHELDPAGRLRVLAQDGWKIEYLDYMDAAGQALPSRLFLRRVAQGEEELEVRLVIERWMLQ